MYSSALVFLFAALFAVGFALLALLHSDLLLKPRRNRQGEFVAEVWLEWAHGRGSTMYRQRFSTQKKAYYFVRLYAWLLDMSLPNAFRTQGRTGPISVSYDMDIKYGVRKISESERQSFNVIWSNSMPGQRDYAGEHQSLHPVFGDKALDSGAA